MIEFRFNEKKTTQVASLFIEKEGGRINYMKLMKLLYIADREALLKWERTLTGDTYFSMKHGPVLSEVLDLISNEEEPEEYSYWHEYITDPEHYIISMKGEYPTSDKLSEREVGLVEELSERFIDFNQWQMRDLCHDSSFLPEWEDVGESNKRIEIETILKKEHKPEEEIQRIAEAIDNLNYVKQILSIED